MEAFERERARRCTQNVRKPVVKIISGASGCERLVKFVQNADQPEDGDSNRYDEFPVGRNRLSPEEVGAEKSAAAEEIAEVGDFIEMRDFRAAGSAAAGR